MPLDPTLARGFDLPKIESPIDQMGGALTNALMLSKMNTSRDESLRNAMLDKVMRARMRPDGTYDQGGVLYDMAQAGLGRGVTGQQKSFADLAETQSKTAENNAQALGAKATAKKAAAETREKLIGMIPMLLKGANTIDDVRTSLSRYAQDPSFIDSMGGLDATKVFFEGIASEAKGAEKMGTFPQWLYSYQTDPKTATEKKVDSRDLGGTMVTSSYNVSGPNAGKLRTETTEKITESPKAPKTIINNNMPGQESVSELDKAIGKGQGDNFLKLEQAALGAPARVRDIDRIVGLIDSGKLFVGTGAEPKLEALRVASMLGVPVDKELIQNTEEVIAGLVQNTLTGISRFEQMGVSLTPMSDKDLQMFRDASPQIKNSPEMIKRLLRVERQMYQDSRKMYNARKVALDSNPRTSPTIKAMSLGSLPEIPDVVPKTVPKWRDGMTGVKGEKVNQRQFNELLANRDNPSEIAEFDGHFGAGSAARILGGAPTGGRPLPR
jgi:hypothetical protein